MNKKFSVNLTNNAKMKNIVFTVEGLEIKRGEINCEVPTVLIDGNEYSDEYSTWSGTTLNNYDLFEDMLNLYLREDTYSVESFGDEWFIFDVIKNKIVRENGVIVAFPFVDYGTVGMYELELATTDYRFYSHFDDCLVLDKDGGVITDYESFYTSALYDELALIKKGETECLYIDSYLKEWCDSEEGQSVIDEIVNE